MADYSSSKAIVMERPGEAKYRDIKLTPMTDDSIVCKTHFSAISSGTDMKTWAGQQHPEKCYYPLVPGYENVGEVVEVGPNVKGVEVGDRVMINECRQFGDVCAAWGGNSEYVIKNPFTSPSPADKIAKLPDNVTYQQAVLGYLACVALKGLYRVPLKQDDNLVVIGAGMIGTSAIQLAKILCPGINVICIERDEYRREIVAKYADHVIAFDGQEAEKLMDITNGKKADKLIECSGNSQMPGILHRYIKDGGWSGADDAAHIHLQGDYPETIVMDSYHRWFVKNCTITMTCALQYECKTNVLNWISEGKFDTSGLPFETWPVQKCNEAYQYKEEKGDKVFKVLFDWENQ